MLQLIVMPHLSAKEEENKRGYKGEIKGTEKEKIAYLISEFKNGKVVEGYAIEGSHIIEIIKNHDYPINIKNSVIIGGLDFSSLQETDIDDIELPEWWNEKQRKEFKEKNRGKKYHIIQNAITIVDSDIQDVLSKNKRKTSVNAESTFFLNKIIFSSATFTGSANFKLSHIHRICKFYVSHIHRIYIFWGSHIHRICIFLGQPHSQYLQILSQPHSKDLQILGQSTFTGSANFWFSHIHRICIF